MHVKEQTSHRCLCAVVSLFIFFGGALLARAVPVIGLTTEDKLVLFDSAAPERILFTTTITGVQTGERILGIDHRPSDGRIYAVGSTSRIYTINITTGAASPVNASPFTPALNVSAFGGEQIGFDFDPVQDRIRIVANGQNLRINPNTGAVVSVDGHLVTVSGEERGQSPAITSIAYSNNLAGATATTLYAIDWRLDRLMTIGSVGGSPVSPNTGQTFEAGRLLGVRFFLNEIAGFDISRDGTAFAALTGTDAVATRLYTVNLGSGSASVVGHIGGNGGGGVFLRGLTVLSPGTNIYVLTTTDRLLLFNTVAPGVILNSATVTGLQTGEHILAIDFRPENGQLYGLGSAGRLYTVNPTTGAATAVGNPPASFTLNGSVFGFDFNPVADLARATSDADQNLRLDPDTGALVASDGTLAYAPGDTNAGQNPKVVGLAYTNSFPGANSTTLYGIDSDRDVLVRIDAPNSGVLSTVGSLGLSTIGNDLTGFDIAPGTNTAYAALAPLCFEGCPTPATLVTVDLTSGRASPVGGIGGGETVRGLAVATTNTIQFSSIAYEVQETCTVLQISVTRSGDTSNEATVDFATTSDNLPDTPIANPASERSDYNAARGTLRFAPGETTKSFGVLINDDSYDERAGGRLGEYFLITLSNPTGGVATGAPAVASVLIRDQGVIRLPNVIDDPSTFVCQHYHDFLNRAPDPAGAAFWTNNIISCGSDAECIARKRIDTSAAFFLSIEFQETGFFVYRTYQAAFARTPVPLDIREFQTDQPKVGEGVVIGQPGALEQLQANKNAYLAAFITRPDFLALYPPTMSPAQYVDALNANAGGVLSPDERDALVAGLAGGTLNRWQVLLAVVEDRDFKRQQLNRAFVLEQYFGYLRRNPNDSPDNDFAGYNFWLAKLNQFNGDFRAAEMVKAFITSGEYRRRFGAQ